MRPLMFFLKCLDSDPEIFELLKREIDVRPRFFLCESENSKTSAWVQREVEYILSKNRQYITVDLQDIDSFDEKIQEMKSRSQIFLSCSRRDTDVGKVVGEALQKRGFNVYGVRNDAAISGEDFSKYIKHKISEVCKNGYFIPIITDSYLQNLFTQTELTEAIKKEGHIVPVIINGTSEEDMMQKIKNNPQLSAIAALNSFVLDTSHMGLSIDIFCERFLKNDRQRNK